MKKPIFYFLALVMTLAMTSCKKDKGDAAATSTAGDVKAATSIGFRVNPDASLVSWEGYKPTGTHNGTVKVSAGKLSMKDGKLEAGSFVIDMNSINVLDLTGDDKAGLEGHLKGSSEDDADHFFNVAKYPKATFEITKVAAVANDAEANTMVYGNLTMKDQTHQIGFKANVESAGNTVKVRTPKFNIDRTKWNVQYGSKSIFKDLGDRFINDEIGLTISLVANK